MNTRKLILGGSLTAVGILALGSIGFAVAQTGDDPGDPGAHGSMAGHAQMGNHADMSGHESMGAMGDMSGHESMGAMGDMPGHGTEQQAQMHDAAARALGITVAELNAELASGKTMAEVAAANGIDLATLRAAMQGAHPGGHGTGMGTDGTAAACHQQS